ncbi:MAG: hypothetical protein ACK5MR_11480 [Cumulibacter sp.]
MRRILTAMFGAAVLLASGCSDDEPEKNDEPALPAFDFSAEAVDAFVQEAAGDRLDCVDVETDALNFTTCLSDNSYTPHLYVFYGEDGAPDRLFVANDAEKTLNELTLALQQTLLADVEGDPADLINSEQITAYDGGAIKGGQDHIVIAADEALAEESFPELPALDVEATAAALEKNADLGCDSTGDSVLCGGALADVQMGSVGSSGPPHMTAQVFVTTENNFFENVPEFLEAAGMPLTAESQQVLDDCDPVKDSCSPRLVTETGLLVELMANFEMTMTEVGGLPQFGD